MPPTTNHLFAGNGRRRYRTKEYIAWGKEAGWLLASQRPPKALGGVSVLIEVSERESTDSWDLANREKATMDLLVEHKVIQGDNRPYVRKFAMEWADIDGIRVTITGL
jgi:Holliday junction resolvase RusA-like endonuclease